MRLLIALILIFFSILPCALANEHPWGLPIEVNDSNTKVTFEVDSTWHMVHGKTSGISGRIWLADEKNFSSMRSEIRFPVASFDTDKKSRDKRMYEVMGAEKYPDVLFEALGSAGLCSPEVITSEIPCHADLQGRLTIHGVSSLVLIPITVTKVDGGHVVTGRYDIKWADFGVEDPSILIAKLDPVVTVSFELSLNEA